MSKHWNIYINRHELFEWASYLFIIHFYPPFSLNVVKSNSLLFGPDCIHAGTWDLWVYNLMTYLFQPNFHTFFFLFWNCEWQLAYCCSSSSQIDKIFQCAYFLREFAFWMNDRVHLQGVIVLVKVPVYVILCFNFFT